MSNSNYSMMTTENVIASCKIWRLRITNVCNANCAFCHGEGFSRSGPNAFLAVERLKYLLNCVICKSDSLAITGGEPLLHRDIVRIIELCVERIGDNCHLNTNGILLDNYLELFVTTGLRHIHVNLASDNSIIYKHLYGIDYSDALWGVLKRAVSLGFFVNINAVVVPGFNDTISYIKEYIRKCSDSGLSLSFIEQDKYMRDSSDGSTFQKFFSEVLNSFDYSIFNYESGRITYTNGIHKVRIAAPCSPAKAYNGNEALDAFVVLENGSVGKYCTHRIIEI